MAPTHLTGEWLAAIDQANTLPLNVAASRCLPPDWRDGGALAILALALWGAEHGIYVELPGGRVSDEAVLDEVLRLMRDPAAQAMAVLHGADPEGDEMVPSDALDGLDRELAARYVLEAIRDWMTSR